MSIKREFFTKFNGWKANPSYLQPCPLRTGHVRDNGFAVSKGQVYALHYKDTYTLPNAQLKPEQENTNIHGHFKP